MLCCRSTPGIVSRGELFQVDKKVADGDDGSKVDIAIKSEENMRVQW